MHPPPLIPTGALSIDVEDYYQVWAFEGIIRRDDWPKWPSHVGDNTKRILDLLAAAGFKATFFVLGCVAARDPALIRAIVAEGHELASHGWDHRLVHRQTPDQFRRDVGRTRALLQDIGGVPVKGYRAASFSITAATWWAFEVLAETGYAYSSSVCPVATDHYGVSGAPRFPFTPIPGSAFLEIPISTIEIGGHRLPCGGGGWFRLAPYSTSRLALQRIMHREHRAAVFYFHPWEIDLEQPRIAGAPMRSRFRHYVNLGTMEEKIRRLLSDFAWSRIDTVFDIASDAGAPISANMQLRWGDEPDRSAELIGGFP